MAHHSNHMGARARHTPPLQECYRAFGKQSAVTVPLPLCQSGMHREPAAKAAAKRPRE